jgi:hypothetical protein
MFERFEVSFVGAFASSNELVGSSRCAIAGNRYTTYLPDLKGDRYLGELHACTLRIDSKVEAFKPAATATPVFSAADLLTKDYFHSLAVIIYTEYETSVPEVICYRSAVHSC